MTRANRSARPARPAVLLLACALATACSESGPDEGPATPELQEEAATGPSEPGEPEVETYPIGVIQEFLAQLDAAGAESGAEQQARLEAEEEIVAACMRDQGFTYTPVDWSYFAEEGPYTPAPERAVTEEDLAFAAEFGYGVSTQSELAPAAGSQPQNPNDAYVAAMSPQEAEAYYDAIYGPGQGQAYIDGLEPYDWTKYGCMGLAGHESGRDVLVAFDDTPFEQVRADIDALWVTIDQDPRIMAANQEWAQCMESAGYPGFDTAASAQTSFFDEEMRILDATHGAAQYDLSTDDYLTSPEYLAAEQAAAEMRAALVERETATAVADVQCQADVDYRRIYAETSAALQQEFYDAHRTDLEAWLAAVEEAYAGQ